MSRKPDKLPEKGRFRDVKKILDPTKSYFIFENDVKRTGDSLLSADRQIYRHLEKYGLSWQKLVDTDLEREYLIIQTEPGDEDDMLGRLMACQLPRDMVYYVYKATP